MGLAHKRKHREPPVKTCRLCGRVGTRGFGGPMIGIHECVNVEACAKRAAARAAK